MSSQHSPHPRPPPLSSSPRLFTRGGTVAALCASRRPAARCPVLARPPRPFAPHRRLLAPPAAAAAAATAPHQPHASLHAAPGLARRRRLRRRPAAHYALRSRHAGLASLQRQRRRPPQWPTSRYQPQARWQAAPRLARRRRLRRRPAAHGGARCGGGGGHPMRRGGENLAGRCLTRLRGGALAA